MSEPADTWRLFVAMPMPERAIAAVSDAQTALKRATPQAAIRWTAAHQFHLTLRFLGEVAVNRLEALQASLQAACAGHAPLDLALQGIGFFPHAQHPRVVWVGVQGDLPPLRALQQAVAGAVAPFAEAPEDHGTFSAHITLGRIKHLTPRERSSLVTAAQHCGTSPLASWRADRVQLLRSTLSNQGPHHECLAAWPLKACSPPA